MRRLGEYITLNLVLLLLWAFLAAMDGSIAPLEGAILFYAAFIGLLHHASIKQFLFGSEPGDDGG
ncbi:hypothetical protein FHS18_000836 [Paenibacillus phyllosphaerae]|uniref:Uncharacterized protein n=1 Tax=Paenibacillus phyllosphaerae TaxID=274593 RepID=A0A7W5FL83_9BACL|nr:hypothetical protein [Paenibacillus phyllosphaerae]MBB3108808.1 hypothetical protein [Paenibacillus phyllosphaerae]